ncbi:MAG: right-handed parallel beta-helix repeat-containing protein [Bacteroidota bacterium]|nr:right-handed parallel beta-helix repeat-containing protein [Bacteroidota bacterium]
MISPKGAFVLISSFLLSLLSTNVFGTVYYVAKTGSDANTCTQAKNKASPKLSIAAGIQCLSAGDTLYIRAGVYNESINEYNVNLPSGTSWQIPATIAGYPGESVTIQPNAGATEVIRIMGPTGGTRYLIFDNLILDGVNGATNVMEITYTGNDPNNTANHIRIKNCELKNAQNNGIYVDSGSSSNEFVNLKIHNNGLSDFDHGMYVSGRNNLIEKCEVYQNAGWGIHIFNEQAPTNATNNIVRNNNIHQNARAGSRGAGIILSSGANNLAYNNLIWGNSGGIQIDYNADNTGVYNNTIWANNVGNIENATGIDIGSGSTGAIVTNNISWNHKAGNIYDIGVGSSFATNLTNKSPLFVDSIQYNFHLQSTSPAINAGTNLSPTVIDDYDGTIRPQGAGYDIGAFEYYSTQAISTIAVNSPTVTEGSSLVFNVTLSIASSTAVVFTPALTSGTATVGTDTGTPIQYSTNGGNTWTTWSSGSITIPPGVTSLRIRVPTIDDAIVEQPETLQLSVNVTSGNTTNTTASGTGTINDNDVATIATIAVSSPTVTEGSSLVFNVTLSIASSTAVVFTPALTSGTATVGTDTGTPIQYSTNGGSTWTTWSSGSITIPAGVTSLRIRVPTIDDAIVEQTETLQLSVSVSSGNTTNTTAFGTGTINDSMAIYPNPVTDKLIVKMSDKADRMMTIMSVLGIVVLESPINDVYNEIDMSNLPKALYIYKLVSGAITLKTGKIILNTH